MRTDTFDIQGMSCDACVRHVTNALLGVEGVTSAQVSLGDRQAVVTYDPDAAGVGQLVKAVTEEGYTATPRAGTE